MLVYNESMQLKCVAKKVKMPQSVLILGADQLMTVYIWQSVILHKMGIFAF